MCLHGMPALTLESVLSTGLQTLAQAQEACPAVELASPASLDGHKLGRAMQAVLPCLMALHASKYNETA